MLLACRCGDTRKNLRFFRVEPSYCDYNPDDDSRSPMWRYERKSSAFSRVELAIREKNCYDSNGNRTRVTAVKGRPHGLVSRKHLLNAHAQKRLALPVILPDLSGLANNEKWEEFNRMLIQAIKIMIVISIPVTAYSLVTGREIITLVYKNNMFDDHSVELTLGEFRFHMAGVVFIALNRIIGPAFYAQKNSKLPTLAGIISFGANILLVLVLTGHFGGKGIACALSIASFVNTVFLFIFMKKLGTMETRRIVISNLLYALKISVMSVIAALPCWFLRPVLLNAFEGHGRLVSAGVPAGLLALLFAVMGVLELIITRDEIAMSIIKRSPGQARG